MRGLRTLLLSLALASFSLANVHDTRLTNGERFSRGLPPNPPAGLERSPTKRSFDDVEDGLSYHQRYRRQGASPGPCPTTCNPELNQAITDYVLTHLDNRVTDFVASHLDNRFVNYILSNVDFRSLVFGQNTCPSPYRKRSALDALVEGRDVQESLVEEKRGLAVDGNTQTETETEVEKEKRSTLVKRGMDPYIGEIVLLPYNFCPRGSAKAAGQLLPISQNTALFSLLGTTYGGNGMTTFALPNLKAQTPGCMLYCIYLEGIYPSRD